MKPNRNGSETIPQPEKPTNHQSEKHPALQITGGTLTFSDGSSVVVGSLANDGSPVTCPVATSSAANNVVVP